MKNVLAKGLIFGVLAGAFLINHCEVDAAPHPVASIKKLFSNNQGKKDMDYRNAQKDLSKKEGELDKVEIELSKRNLSASKRKSAEAKKQKLIGEIAKLKALVESTRREVERVENLNNSVNLPKLQSCMTQLKTATKDLEKLLKAFDKNGGGLEAMQEKIAQVYRIANEMNSAANGRRFEVLSSIQGTNRGRSQDEQDYRVRTNYGRPEDGDYYLNDIRNRYGSPLYSEDNRDHGDRFHQGVGETSRYSRERIGSDPDWALQEGKYYRTGNNGSSAQGNRSIQRTSSLTRLGENSSGSQSRVLNRNSSQGNLGNYSPAKKSDLDWDSDGGFGDVNYHEGTSMMR